MLPITYVSEHGARYAILLPFDPTSSYPHPPQYHEQHLKFRYITLCLPPRSNTSPHLCAYITVPLMLETLPPSCPRTPFSD